MSHRPRLLPDDVVCAAAMFGFTVMFQREIAGYDDQNIAITGTFDGGPSSAFMKVSIATSEERKNRVMLQGVGMDFLDKAGARVPALFRVITGPHTGKSELEFTPTSGAAEADGVKPAFSARMMQFVEGPMLSDVPYTAATLFNLGADIGGFNKALLSFTCSHPVTGGPAITVPAPFFPVDAGVAVLAMEPSVWDLQHARLVRSKIGAIKSAELRDLAQQCLDEFESDLVAKLAHLRRSWIHGDLNDRNIIMAPAGKDTDGEDSFRVGAFIDFEDFCYTPLINELAIALAYTLMRAIGCGTAALLDMVTNVLKGYCSNLLLRDDELEVLLPLIKLRLVTSISMSATTILADPSNEEYLLVHARPAMTLLQELTALDKDVFLQTLKDAVAVSA